MATTTSAAYTDKTAGGGRLPSIHHGPYLFFTYKTDARRAENWHLSGRATARQTEGDRHCSDDYPPEVSTGRNDSQMVAFTEGGRATHAARPTKRHVSRCIAALQTFSARDGACCGRIFKVREGPFTPVLRYLGRSDVLPAVCSSTKPVFLQYPVGCMDALLFCLAVSLPSPPPAYSTTCYLYLSAYPPFWMRGEQHVTNCAEPASPTGLTGLPLAVFDRLDVSVAWTSTCSFITRYPPKRITIPNDGGRLTRRLSRQPQRAWFRTNASRFALPKFIRRQTRTVLMTRRHLNA